MLSTLAEYISRFDVFSGIDFEELYSWMPTDIKTSLTAALGVLFVLAIVGLVRKFIPLS